MNEGCSETLVILAKRGRGSLSPSPANKGDSAEMHAHRVGGETTVGPGEADGHHRLETPDRGEAPTKVPGMVGKKPKGRAEIGPEGEGAWMPDRDGGDRPALGQERDGHEDPRPRRQTVDAEAILVNRLAHVNPPGRVVVKDALQECGVS